MSKASKVDEFLYLIPLPQISTTNSSLQVNSNQFAMDMVPLSRNTSTKKSSAILLEVMENIRPIIPSPKKSIGPRLVEEKIGKILSILPNVHRGDLEMIGRAKVLFILREYLVLDEYVSSRGLLIKVFGLLLKNQKCAENLRRMNIHNLIAFYFDTEDSLFKECCMLMLYWIDNSPKEFPRILANSLKAYLSKPDIDTDSRYNCIELLRLLVLGNIALVYEIDGIGCLIDAVLNHQFILDSKDKKLIPTIIHLLDDPQSRSIMMRDMNFARIFGVLCDLKSRLAVEDIFGHHLGPQLHLSKANSLRGELYKNVLVGARTFLRRLMNSFAGLFFLYENTRFVETLIDGLRQRIDREAKLQIIELFEDLFSINESLQRNLSLLVLLINLLLQVKFTDSLIILLKDPEVAEKAQNLLRSFLKLSYRTLPQGSLPKIEEMLKEEDPEEAENSEETDIVRYVKKWNIFGNTNSVLDRSSAPLFVQCEAFYFGLNYYSRSLRYEILFSDSFAFSFSHNFLQSLPEDVGSWEWFQVFNFLKSIKKKATLLSEFMNSQAALALLYFAHTDLLEISWSSENLIVMRVLHEFFRIIFTTENVQILFKEYKSKVSFSDGIRILLTHRRDRLLSYLAPEKNQIVKNDNKKQLVASRIEIDDQPSPKPYETSILGRSICPRNSSNQTLSGGHLSRLRPIGSNIYFKQTFARELLILLAKINQWVNGIDYLKEIGFFRMLCDLVTPLGTYDPILTVVIPTVNVETDPGARNFFLHILSHGTISLKRMTYNLLFLIMESDNAPILISVFLERTIDKIRNGVTIESIAIAEMLLRQMLVFSESEVDIFSQLGIDIIKKSSTLLYAFLQKEKTAGLIIRSGILDELLKNFWDVDLISVYTSHVNQIERVETTEREVRMSENKFKLKLSITRYQNLSTLMRYPWGMIIKMKRAADSEWEEFYAHPMLAVDVKKEVFEVKVLLTEGMFSKTKFLMSEQVTFCAAVTLGDKFITSDMTANEGPTWSSMTCPFKHQTKNEILPLGKWEFKDGMMCQFNPGDEEFELLSISIPIYIDSSQVQLHSVNSNLLDILCKTEAGTDYLLNKNENCMDILNNHIFKSTDIDSFKIHLFSLGILGQNIISAEKLLSQQSNFIERVLNNEKRDKLLAPKMEYLSVRGLMINVANMFTISKRGREVLRNFKWEVNLVYKKSNDDSDDIYIAYSKSNFFANSESSSQTSQVKKSTTGLELYDSTLKVAQKTKEATPVKSKFLDLLRAISIKSRRCPDLLAEITKGKAVADPFYKDISCLYVLLTTLTAVNMGFAHRVMLWKVFRKFMLVFGLFYNWDRCDEIYKNFNLTV